MLRPFDPAAEAKWRTGPLGDRVVLLPIEDDSLVGGMARPQTAVEQARKGVVVAVGHGRFTEQGVLLAMSVRVGDLVSFPPYAGFDLFMDLDGQPRLYRVAREDELAFNHGPASAPSSEETL